MRTPDNFFIRNFCFLLVVTDLNSCKFTEVGCALTLWLYTNFVAKKNSKSDWKNIIKLYLTSSKYSLQIIRYKNVKRPFGAVMFLKRAYYSLHIGNGSLRIGNDILFVVSEDSWLERLQSVTFFLINFRLSPIFVLAIKTGDDSVCTCELCDFHFKTLFLPVLNPFMVGMR